MQDSDESDSENLSEEGDKAVLRLSYPSEKLKHDESSEESEGAIFSGEYENFYASSNESSR